MLGKGLESLIPQKGNQGQGGQQNDGRPQGPGFSSPQQPQPQTPASHPVQPVQPLQQQSQPQPPRQFQHPGTFQSTPLIPKKEPAAPQGRPQPQSNVQQQPQSQAQSQQQSQQQSHSQPQQQHSTFQIELDKITPNPDQPRRSFDQEGLRELANSIREFGMLQPIVVSQVKKESANGIDVEYQIIAGERRYMAAKMLGLARVPAVVRNVSLEREKLELGVIENIQREDLNPMEMARAFQRLQEEFRMTQREIAAKLGKSREVVANSVRLLDLPEDIQKAVEDGAVSESNARMLLALEDAGLQRRLLQEIVNDKLTTRDVRERIQRYTFINNKEAGMAAAGNVNLGIVPGMKENQPNAPRRGRPPLKPIVLPPEVRMLKDELSTELGAPIEIRKTAHNGQISITFFSEEELENILRKLGGRE